MNALTLNRRRFIKSSALTFGALAVTGPVVLMQAACGDTSQLIRWTTVLIGALKDVSPILTNMGAGSIVALIGQAIPFAEKLKKAFEDNDHASSLQFLDNLINPESGIIVQIANQVNLLSSDAQKRIVQGVLAIGMVALRLIAANIAEEVPQEAVTRARSAKPKAVASLERASKGDALEAAFAAARF